MTLEDLVEKFVLAKNDKPSDVNELLDFLQKDYVNGNLPIQLYRKLFRELDSQGAVKPFYSQEEILYG
ncbi:YppF family protein [Ammoniphilus resinae]|uniref:YppF-like protein n=1 Tax=Ammoniphilus resinae TaxID=861532 RepID=A0ABS4GN11_9BACL|nr:YppF family protein [Ammoniphilus resinae]MBP1931648.1 hypothetical protein [Ammoniphilus resinae]